MQKKLNDSLSWRILKFFYPLFGREFRQLIDDTERAFSPNQPIQKKSKESKPDRDKEDNEDLDEFNNENLAEDYGVYDKGK